MGLNPVQVVPVRHCDLFYYTSASHWLSSIPQYTQWWSHNSSTPHFQRSYNAVSHFLVRWDGGNINRALDEPYKAYFMHTHSAWSQRTSQSAKFNLVSSVRRGPWAGKVPPLRFSFWVFGHRFSIDIFAVSSSAFFRLQFWHKIRLRLSAKAFIVGTHLRCRCSDSVLQLSLVAQNSID